MTHVYSAGGSRRSAVFTAIIALHFAVFLVVLNDRIPVGTNVPDSRPVTLLPRIPPNPEYVPPEKPVRVEIDGYVPSEPVIIIPTFDDVKVAPTEPMVGADYQDGSASQHAAVVRVAASLQGLSSGFANIVRACYPAQSRRASEEGKVLLAVMIDARGQAKSWRIVQSSGFPLLDSAAGCVVEKLKFNAAREDGRAVQSEVLLPIVFRLD
jgi:periplasmic protein TonB